MGPTWVARLPKSRNGFPVPSGTRPRVSTRTGRFHKLGKPSEPMRNLLQRFKPIRTQPQSPRALEYVDNLGTTGSVSLNPRRHSVMENRRQNYRHTFKPNERIVVFVETRLPRSRHVGEMLNLSVDGLL